MPYSPVDVQTELADSRKIVDRQLVFGDTGEFRSEHVELLRLRQGIDDGPVSAGEVATLFNHIGSQIDDRWQHIFDRLSTTGASSASPATKSRLTALDLSLVLSPPVSAKRTCREEDPSRRC